ncbi:uncharacterized protein LOC105694170 isoform X2 [Orussus abietinus]|uniref:uncharacterized protein LOC105694170 isoform X2 n=1 Tax=Orussus abietinus TaxID=222816 RepID=UPI000626B460|nr:uncharacterized protein LOC105694170 isoform X2 [Orussus abietinus]
MAPSKAILILLLAVSRGWCDFRHQEEQETAISQEVPQDSTEHDIRSEPTNGSVPLSTKRLEKMLKKAILKIITSDLSSAEMLFLKSLNYSFEEVMAIRERELGRKKMEAELRAEDEEDQSKKGPLLGAISRRRKKPQRTRNQQDFRQPDTDGNRMELDYEDLKRERDWRKELIHEKRVHDKDFDFDAFNKQAVYDYENEASRLERGQSWKDLTTHENKEDQGRSNQEETGIGSDFHRSSVRAMEPHVIFKIRYDDSEFDSSSDEKTKPGAKENGAQRGHSFHADTTYQRTPLPLAHRVHLGRSRYLDLPRNVEVPGETILVPPGTDVAPTGEPLEIPSSSSLDLENDTLPADGVNGTRDNEIVQQIDRGTEFLGNDSLVPRRVSEYEGLEWVEDDVYRVIPEVVESLNYDNEENETSDYYEQNTYYQGPSSVSEDNDTADYLNESPDPVQHFVANANGSNDSFPTGNLSTYHQAALAHRRDQGQKVIEDIKMRVLAMTGRFNHSANSNQVQRERLTMFSPTCQTPRNTDAEAWADPFSMNMHFQLNLTSGEHVVAAKLRLFKLPQENATTTSTSTFEEDEDDEKKIRISVYFYTKSLKKHRSKKRLMDSIVTSLTPTGSHLALDVRQGLRFWRLNPRNGHSSNGNHGLVVQIEDQDGRPLKPALFVQQPSCQADHDQDEKAYQRVPSLFVRACSRYVHIVDGEAVTFLNCKLRNERY